MVSIKLYDPGLVFCPKTDITSDLSGPPCPAHDRCWAAWLPFSQGQCSLPLIGKKTRRKNFISLSLLFIKCQEYVLCWSSSSPFIRKGDGRRLPSLSPLFPQASLLPCEHWLFPHQSHISPTSVGAASSQPRWHMKVPVHRILEHPGQSAHLD